MTGRVIRASMKNGPSGARFTVLHGRAKPEQPAVRT